METETVIKYVVAAFGVMAAVVGALWRSLWARVEEATKRAQELHDKAEAKHKEQQQQLRHRQQPASGVSSRPAFQAERIRLANPLLNNPYAQRAFRNLSSRAYANPEMNRIGRDLRVALTRRQGQRTIGVEPARMPKVTKTAAANVRKEPKAVT